MPRDIALRDQPPDLALLAAGGRLFRKPAAFSPT